MNTAEGALTCNAEQHGEVWVVALSPLGKDVAEGAEVTQTGGHLSIQPLGEPGSHGEQTTATLRPLTLKTLLQCQTVFHQLLVLH